MRVVAVVVVLLRRAPRSGDEIDRVLLVFHGTRVPEVGGERATDHVDDPERPVDLLVVAAVDPHLETVVCGAGHQVVVEVDVRDLQRRHEQDLGGDSVGRFDREAGLDVEARFQIELVRVVGVRPELGRSAEVRGDRRPGVVDRDGDRHAALPSATAPDGVGAGVGCHPRGYRGPPPDMGDVAVGIGLVREAFVSGLEVPRGAAVAGHGEVGEPGAVGLHRDGAARCVVGIEGIPDPDLGAGRARSGHGVSGDVHIGDEEVAQCQRLRGRAVGDLDDRTDVQGDRSGIDGEVAAAVGRERTEQRPVDGDVDRRIRGEVVPPEVVPHLVGEEPRGPRAPKLGRVVVVVVLGDGSGAFDTGVVRPGATVGDHAGLADTEHVDADLAAGIGRAGQDPVVPRIEGEVRHDVVADQRDRGGTPRVDVETRGDVEIAVEVEVRVAGPVVLDHERTSSGTGGAIAAQQQLDAEVVLEAVEPQFVGDRIDDDFGGRRVVATRVSIRVVETRVHGVPIGARLDVEPRGTEVGYEGSVTRDRGDDLAVGPHVEGGACRRDALHHILSMPDRGDGHLFDQQRLGHGPTRRLAADGDRLTGSDRLIELPGDLAGIRRIRAGSRDELSTVADGDRDVDPGLETLTDETGMGAAVHEARGFLGRCLGHREDSDEECQGGKDEQERMPDGAGCHDALTSWRCTAVPARPVSPSWSSPRLSLGRSAHHRRNGALRTSGHRAWPRARGEGPRCG